MTSPQTTKQKIYCYVDETGQDTEGELFFVAVVIVGNDREKVRRILENIEVSSGKRSRKWTRSTRKQREVYMSGVLKAPAVEGLYYSRYTGARAYVELSILSAAKAINKHMAEEAYQATILVDGLHAVTEQRRFASGLKKLRINARKVRGVSFDAALDHGNGCMPAVFP